jgi:hypothetical protein
VSKKWPGFGWIYSFLLSFRLIYTGIPELIIKNDFLLKRAFPEFSGNLDAWSYEPMGL